MKIKRTGSLVDLVGQLFFLFAGGFLLVGLSGGFAFMLFFLPLPPGLPGWVAIVLGITCTLTCLGFLLLLGRISWHLFDEYKTGGR